MAKTIPLESMVGLKFGLWTVLRFNRSVVSRYPSGKSQCKKYYDCVCDCGVERSVELNRLRTGYATSCGCLTIVSSREKRRKYRYPVQELKVEYQAWINMRRRCEGVAHQNTKNYVANGITVCQEWKNDFGAFFIDMGRRPDWATSIDRIDNLKGYCKENCRWATSLMQNENTSQNKHFEFNGKRQLLTQWAREYGINYSTLYARLYQHKWTLERALLTVPGNTST